MKHGKCPGLYEHVVIHRCQLTAAPHGTRSGPEVGIWQIPVLSVQSTQPRLCRSPGSPFLPSLTWFSWSSARTVPRSLYLACGQRLA